MACERVGTARAINDLLFGKGIKETVMVNKSPKRKKIGALSIKNVTKIYDPSGVNVKAVDDCSMEIAGGEVCMIVGPSGCGLSLIHI